MESDENEEETQASFCRFLDDNFKLPISAYAPGCVPKVEIKERLDRSERLGIVHCSLCIMNYFLEGLHLL